MPCTEHKTDPNKRIAPRQRWPGLLLAVAALALGACAGLPGYAPPAAVPVAPGSGVPAAWPGAVPGAAPGVGPGASRAPAPQAATGASTGSRLAAPATPRSWDEFKLQAARRMVAAHPGSTYMDTPPPLLLGVPVIETELNADGSVRSVSVVRRPSNAQAQDTVQLAIDAIHRAAPYGDISRLPRPWKWTEVFLFNDQRQFKPRTLDN